MGNGWMVQSVNAKRCPDLREVLPVRCLLHLRRSAGRRDVGRFPEVVVRVFRQSEEVRHSERVGLGVGSCEDNGDIR